MWNVSPAAKAATERARTTALAGHREYHKDFQDERPVQSVVSRAAMTARPSEYISSLALPKQRSEGPFRNPQWPVSIRISLHFIFILTDLE